MDGQSARPVSAAGMGTSVKVKLTIPVLKAAQPILLPDGSLRQRILFDIDTQGLLVVVGKNTKTFYAQRNDRRVKLGRFGELTLDQARTRARDKLLELSGIAPVRQATSAAVTLREALALTIKTMTARGRSEDTRAKCEYNINKYLADWLDRPLASTTKAEANARHHKIAADIRAGKYATVQQTRKKTGKACRAYTRKAPRNGEVQANGVMVSFRAVYNRAARAAEAGAELPPIPTANVDFYKARKSNDAILSKDLPEWYAAACALDNPVRRDILLFGLFTGLRRGTLQEMRWEHVHWETKALLIPNPKGGEERAFILPLSDFLVEILERRQACEYATMACLGSPWVFPSCESESGHISEMKLSAAQRNDPRTRAASRKPHALRHTFITQATALGIPEAYIKVLVNHSIPASAAKSNVTLGYITPEFEDLQVRMNRIADRLRELCGLPPPKKQTKK